MINNIKIYVSVIIPSYNYANFLINSINSVLSQTYNHFELIVIDDGSTDSTQFVCKRIKDPRFIYVYQKNSGLSSARNAGIARSKYNLLAFLDADDIWENTFLESILKYYIYHDGKYTLLATASKRINSDGKIISNKSFSFGNTGELKLLNFFLRNKPLSSSVLIEKNVISVVGGFDSRLKSSEDRDYWIRSIYFGFKFFFIDIPFVKIRRHQNNMSQNAPVMMANTGNVLTRGYYNSFIPKKSFVWIKIASIYLYESSLTYYYSNRILKAYIYIIASILIYPIIIRVEKIQEKYLFRLRTIFKFLLKRR